MISCTILSFSWMERPVLPLPVAEILFAEVKGWTEVYPHAQHPQPSMFSDLCCKQQGLCQIPSSEAICILLAVWNYILQLQSEQRGCQQNETGITFSHPSMLLSVSKAAICLNVSEGRQYCFSSSIRSFRASLSMWANTSLSKNGRRGPSISMEAPMRPCSEMPYQWRQNDFKQYVLCKSAQSDYLAYLTCIAIQV